MKKKALKEWTIIIYANGNNELEPEMAEMLHLLEKENFPEDINIVIQIARWNRELSKLLRPLHVFKEEETWEGCRRYYIKSGTAELMEELGEINMADPHTLYDFIIWATARFTSKRTAVIISGHGASYAAAMPDFTHEVPYMMGIPEMCTVLNKLYDEYKKNIDLLILDLCFMNIIEIMYELGKGKVNAVKNVITYIRSGPLRGMPCEKIIQYLNPMDDNVYVAKKIVETIDQNLVAVKIDYPKLRNIRTLVNNIAYSYLSSEIVEPKDPRDILYRSTELDSHNKDIAKLEKEIASIVIAASAKDPVQKPLEITASYLVDETNQRNLLRMYFKLSFARNNLWSNVLAKQPLEERLNNFPEINLRPIQITRKSVKNMIKAMNFHLKDEELERILKELITLRNWHI